MLLLLIFSFLGIMAKIAWLTPLCRCEPSNLWTLLEKCLTICNNAVFKSHERNKAFVAFTAPTPPILIEFIRILYIHDADIRGLSDI